MKSMVVTRRAQNPWAEMERLWGPLFNNSPESQRRPFVHVENGEDSVTLKVELPGFSSQDIDIQIDDNLLTIRAMEESTEETKGKEKIERRTVYEKSFVIPEDLDKDVQNIDAEMKNGLLKLTIPRLEKPAPRAVTVRG